jgi:ketosteroid isomerase-like protein
VSERNVELVRSVYDPLDGVNIATIDWGLEMIREMLGQAYSPKLELTTLASGAGSGVDEHYSGADGLVRYLQEWLEPFSEYTINNYDYAAVGECVLVQSRQRGVGATSGASVELELTTVHEVRDGLIVRVHQYDTFAEARADAERTEA